MFEKTVNFYLQRTLYEYKVKVKWKKDVMFKFFKSLKDSVASNSDNQNLVSDEYMKSLSGTELKIKSDEQRLEAMVRQQLKEEFPNIEKSSSYDLLVDAVIHNYKSKQLQAADDAVIKAD